MRKALLLLGGVLLLIIVALGIVAVTCFAAFSDPNGGFGIPPQDCELHQIDLKGKVVDSQGKPIPDATIQITNLGGPGMQDGKVKLTLITDTNGKFANPVQIFRCDTVIVQVRAVGYSAKELRFSADDTIDSSLSHEISITLP